MQGLGVQDLGCCKTAAAGAAAAVAGQTDCLQPDIRRPELDRLDLVGLHDWKRLLGHNLLADDHRFISQIPQTTNRSSV